MPPLFYCNVIDSQSLSMPSSTWWGLPIKSLMDRDCSISGTTFSDMNLLGLWGLQMRDFSKKCPQPISGGVGTRGKGLLHDGTKSTTLELPGEDR